MTIRASATSSGRDISLNDMSREVAGGGQSNARYSDEGLAGFEAGDAPMMPPENGATTTPALGAERITNVHAAEASGRQGAALAGAGSAASAGAVSLPGSPEVAAESRALGYRFVKRTFDICFSFCVCAAGLIPGAILCAFIAADTKGAPIYAHERAGRFGRPIHVLKFRSMVADADDVEKYLSLEQIEEWHRERKVKDDPRITKLGRVLRKTSLDELPQFFNVLAGQLSVIGPRAITYEELGNFTHEQQVQVLAVPQGITGAWQSGPRNEATFENGERQCLELDYARSASLGRDFGVFFATFGVMFGKNKTGR